MTHFNNLITMTNVMRHNSLTAVNPDGQPTVNRQSKLTSYRGWCKKLTMIFAVLVMSMANVGMAWADTELANINFKSWTPQSISAGSTVNGCYFKSAVTISADKGATFGGNATTSLNWVAIPLSGINGSITITLTHASSRPQWKNYFKGLNAAPSSSDLSSNPASVGDNTRPGSNTTTSSWTINTDKLYGVFYVGKGSNGLSDIYSIRITTPDWTYYYRGADNSWGADAMTKSSEGFYSYKSSSTNDHQFKIAKSTDGWDYNYSFVDAGYLGTSITTIGDYNSNNCYIWSAPASYYIIVFRPGSVMNTTANPKICASATLPAEKFTISFNNGGGSGSMSSISNVLYGSEKATTANSFTKVGYRFTGWKADVDVKVGGSTKTAGTLLADGVTIQDISSNITLTAQWEEVECPSSGTLFSMSMNNVGTAKSIGENEYVDLGSNSYATVSGGSAIFGASASGKATIVKANPGQLQFGGAAARLQVTLDCPLQQGDVISFTPASSGSYELSFDYNTTRVTTPATSSQSYTIPAESSLIGRSTIYFWRSAGTTFSITALSITRPDACSATQPGTIGKGTLSACTLRLTAAGSPASNNTWYWQSSESGTDKTESGATKDVTTTGTYYIRSYCSTGSGCWSDARSVVVSASDLTPAAPSALAAASPTAKGVTLTVTDAANTNNYDFYVSTSSTVPTSGSTPTYSVSESKSLTITNLVAGTTYYTWARAKCGSNKSAWTALTGSTFTTSTVTVTHTLTNVTKTSGAETAGGSNYTAVFAAVSGYSMPTPTVTIDGNTATSGTDYTWSSGTLTIPANKINGNIVITLNSVPSAPSSATISGAYHYFPGESISLTVTPTGNNGPTAYQWYKGGKENGNAIEGATTATYTKATCAFDDAGSYYCKVTCNATSIWAESGNSYDVKILRLYVNGSKSGEPYGNVDFVKVDGTTATASIALGSGWTYGFNIADGCGHYYGNAGTMTENNCTNWVTNVNGTDCGLTTTNAATYIFTINYSNLSEITTSVTYPSANQASGKVIYFDNNVLKWTGSSIYYRIGHSSHSQADQLSLVPGTANLYKMTTRKYDGFSAWQIGNAEGGNGSDKSIYNTKNTPAITASIAYEGGAVTADAVTVTPGVDHSTGEDEQNNNCEFYIKTITNGMKTDRVTISPYSNGTITVNYTNTSNVASTLTSGSADLAHTVILSSITAVANTGYDAGAITINGGAYSANYVVTGNTTIAATFSPHVYSITYKDQGGSDFSGTHTDTPSAHPTSHTYNTATDLNSATKAGYTFDGWYTTSACTGDPVTSLGATDYTADITLYAKWTEDADACYEFAPTKTSGDISSNATVAASTGGTMTYTPVSGSSPTLKYKTQGVEFGGSGNCKVTVTLNDNMQAGTIITARIISTQNGSDRGLYLQNSSGTTKGNWYWSPTAAEEAKTFTYTVTADDGLAGSKTFIIARKTNAYLASLTVTNCSDACTPPTAPTALGVDSKDETSATLSWDGGSAGANGYKIKLVANDGGSGAFDWKDCTSATYTATGLTAGKSYTFSVKYKGTGAQCEFSDEVTTSFTTDEAESPCTTPTMLFSMVVSNSASNYTLAAGTTINQSDEAISSRLTSISGGGISITNNSGSSNKTVFSGNALSLLNADVQCAIALTGATLQAGDVITVTTTSSGKPYLTSTAAKSNEVTWSTSSYTHSITLANTSNATGKNLIGKSTFYLWYGGSSVYIRSISVTRPCDESAETCKTPNITNVASTTNMTTAETKSLDVTVSNTTALTGTVSYAWTNADGSAIAAAAKATGTTTARLTLTEPAAGTYTFKCTVTNDCGGGDSQSATSAVFTVVVTASTGCTEIAKVIVSGTSTGTDSGTKIAETGGYGVKLENTTAAHGGNTGYKIGSSNYVYLQLASGEQFQNGDKVKVYITKVSDQGDHKLHIFQGTTAAGTEVATVNSPALGWNETTLSGVTSGNRSLTIHRSSGTTEQNHYIYAFAVERCKDCSPATHEGLAYTKTSYTVGETAEALTVTNPENVDTYQWKYNTTNDRTGGTNCGTGTASFTPPIDEFTGTRYYWCELTNDCGTVKTSAVGITVSAVLSDVTVAWTAPAEVNYGGGGYTITAQVTPAGWDGTLTASMLTAPEGIRIYGVEINNTEHTLQAKFDVQTTFDREANATAIPFALTLAATANYDGKIDEHNVAYSACAGGGGGGVLFSQNFNGATEVAYTNGTETAITTSSGNNIVGSTAASQFTYIGIAGKSKAGIAINTTSGGNSQDITGAFQAYANNSSGKYALVKNTNFAASAPTALRIEADVWFHTLSSTTDYSLSFAVGESFSNSTGGVNASNVHSGFSFYNASAVYLYAYKDKNTKISGTNQFTQSKFQKVTWVINNTGDDLEYTNPAGTKSTLGDDKFDVWVGTKQFVSGQAASTGTKALQNLYIGDPNGKSHEFRLDNVTVTDISTSSGTGTITTALTWSNSKASGATLEKDEGTADFAVTAVRDAAATISLGALTYSSSDPSVATVNETTGQVHIADNIDFGGATYKETIITATLAASGCYKRAEITYVLRVNKRACGDVAGTVTSTSDGCTTTLTLSGYTAGATIQWYKDGASLGSADGAQTATYTTSVAGEYYAVTHSTCDRTSNTVTVTSTAVSATKLVDEWYVKNGRRTPDIALVQTENASSFTITSGGSPITNIGGCEFYLGTDGIIYLKGAQNDGSDPSGMTEGDDVLSITATGCSDAAPVSVTIHRQVETDKYVLAYVVTGKQDGGWTQDPPSTQTTGVELYRTLNNHFDLQATNIYATTDEQKIKEYYSRYDIIFITDYPNTKTKNETTKKSYVDALGAMIDIRPILTMEAWVSGLSNWSAKGVAGNPKSPTTRQYNMLLQCKDHEIFNGTTVETIGEGDEMMFKINMVDSTKALYDTLDTKYGAGTHKEKEGYCYGKHPALQGFVYNEALADMLPLGLIDDGAGNDLQVGLERQKEMEARMMVLGINADAMERLSEDGETVIVNALKYLMKKDAEDIEDCSNYFIGGAEGDAKNWHNVANWTGNTLPTKSQKVRILAECELNASAHVAGVTIVNGGKYNHGNDDAKGKLTINAGGALTVEGKVQEATAPNYYETRPTSATDLILNTNSEKQAALIFDNEEAETQATVKLYSLGRKPSSYQYQYFAVPMEVVPVNPTFANETHGGTGIYTYVYSEATSGWTRRKYYDDLFAFEGLGITTKSTGAMNYTMTGNLASTATKEITLTHDGAGLNLVGNSWMAPIQIGALAEDNTDANITKTVYIYCAGRDAVKGAATSGDTETAGQWLAVPFEAASFATWKDAGKLSVIPAMQAFQIKVSAEATLTLDYKKVVRGSTNDLNAKLRAPGRRMAANEVTMTNIRVADSKTHTDLSLFEGDRFSEAFDNGWEAEYMSGDGRSAKLYAETETGKMAVVAMTDYEGTVVGFAPGQETEYTFSFMGEDNGYYLNDIKLQNSVRISEGETYTFTYEEGDAANRFYISRTAINAPAVTTGMENLDAAAPKVQKIIYNDKLYIIRGGRLYDATGKVVK